jgi:hypothetical protein
LVAELGRQPRYSESIGRLKQRGLAQKTAEKYERLFRISRIGLGKWSEKDRNWLVREYGKQSLSQEWWLDKQLRCWEAKARATGVLAEIRQIMDESMTKEQMCKSRDEAEKRRRRLMSGV